MKIEVNIPSEIQNQLQLIENKEEFIIEAIKQYLNKIQEAEQDKHACQIKDDTNENWETL